MCKPRRRGRDSPAASEEFRNVAATPRGLQRVHLIFHQRDERRDDDGESGPHERGKLEAERFAAAGRQQGEDVLARERVADDFLLQRAERSEAEELFQRCEEWITVKSHQWRIKRRLATEKCKF